MLIIHCKFYSSSENTVLAVSLLPRSLWTPSERRHCSTCNCKAADKQELLELQLLMRMDTAMQLPRYQCRGTETLAQPQNIPLFPFCWHQKEQSACLVASPILEPLWFRPRNCDSHWVTIQEPILLSLWDSPHWGQQWVLQHSHPPLKTCMSQNMYPLKY